MTSQDYDDNGGEEGKLLLGKVSRKGGEPLTIQHKISQFCIFGRVHWADLMVILLAQYKNGTMRYSRLQPGIQMEPFLHATAGFPRERLPERCPPTNSVVNR